MPLPPVKISVPAIFSTNIRSLVTKTLGLSLELQSLIHSYSYLRVLYTRVTTKLGWCGLIRVNRQLQIALTGGMVRQEKKTASGMATQTNCFLSGKSEIIHNIPNGIDGLTNRCYPQLPSHNNTIITNLYRDPLSLHRNISTFWWTVKYLHGEVDYTLSAFFLIVFSTYCPHFLRIFAFYHGRFQPSPYPRTIFDPMGLHISPARGKSPQAETSLNILNCFLKLGAPIFSSSRYDLFIHSSKQTKFI